MWSTRFPHLRQEVAADRIRRAWEDESELLLSFVAGPIRGRAFVTGDVLNLLPALTADAPSFDVVPDYHDLSEFFEKGDGADAFAAVPGADADFSVVGHVSSVDALGQSICVTAVGMPLPLDPRRVPPLAKRMPPGARVAFRVKGLQLWL